METTVLSRREREREIEREPISMRSCRGFSINNQGAKFN